MRTVDQQLARVLCCSQCRCWELNPRCRCWELSPSRVAEQQGLQKGGFYSWSSLLCTGTSGTLGRCGQSGILFFLEDWSESNGCKMMMGTSRCALSGQVRATTCLSGTALQQRRACFLLSFPFLSLFASLARPPLFLWVCFRFHTHVWGSRANKFYIISESVSSVLAVPLMKSEFLVVFWRGGLEAFLGKWRGIFQRKTSSAWEMASFFINFTLGPWKVILLIITWTIHCVTTIQSQEMDYT